MAHFVYTVFMYGKNKIHIGVHGEDLALREYQLQGYDLIARNVANPNGKRFGEIDLVVHNSSELVFVEVKTRRIGGSFSVWDSVGPQKLRRLFKIIRWYLWKHPEARKLKPRLDVCLVEYSNLDKSLKNVIIISNAAELD